MRRFIFVSHLAPADGSWSLNDLPGTGGRIDVVCRNLQSAFFLSHGLRSDVEAYVVFAAGRTVRLRGDELDRFHPDERSTAARLQQALASAWSVPDWKVIQRGLELAAFGLEGLLDELPADGLILLDPDGEDAYEAAWPPDCTFVVSDHVPLTSEEQQMVLRRGARRISLGPSWYHGNHAVAVVHSLVDRQLGPSPTR